MKQHLKYIFTLPLFAIIIALASWEAPTSTYEGENEGVVKSADNQYFAVGDYNVFDYRIDTLTNAETNNLFIGRRDNSVWNTVSTPTNFLSLYTYDIKVLPVSLSGTQSVKVVLDASNMRSGTSTDWCAIDSSTATVSTKVFQLRSTEATANRYRLRVIGSGTQSSTYTIRAVFKKTN